MNLQELKDKLIPVFFTIEDLKQAIDNQNKKEK
jgi:hypothetical protein